MGLLPSSVLIFKMNPNLFIHNKPPWNGRQFTAEDAAWNLMRIGGLFADKLKIPLSSFQRASMVDKITKIEGTKIVGVKNVSVNEPYFQGHFPNHPIMPGVLQLEAIAQVAGIMMLKQIENAGKLAYFMAAENVRWRKPVVPGDQLVIEVELTRARGKIGKAKGICKVRGDVVSEAEVTFMLREG